MSRRDDKRLQEIQERYDIAAGNKKLDVSIKSPRGDSQLRNQVAYKLAHLQIGNLDNKAYRKVERSGLLHRALLITAMGGGIALGMHQHEAPGIDRVAGYEMVVIGGSSLAAGANRYRALRGANRLIVKAHPQGLRNHPDYQNMVRTLEDSSVKMRSSMQAASVALSGVGTTLLTTAVEGGSVAGLSEPKVQAIAGAASLAIGVVHGALDGFINTKVGDKVAGYMYHGLNQHGRAQRP